MPLLNCVHNCNGRIALVAYIGVFDFGSWLQTGLYSGLYRLVFHLWNMLGAYFHGSAKLRTMPLFPWALWLPQRNMISGLSNAPLKRLHIPRTYAYSGCIGKTMSHWFSTYMFRRIRNFPCLYWCIPMLGHQCKSVCGGTDVHKLMSSAISLYSIQ